MTVTQLEALVTVVVIACILGVGLALAPRRRRKAAAKNETETVVCRRCGTVKTTYASGARRYEFASGYMAPSVKGMFSEEAILCRTLGHDWPEPEKVQMADITTIIHEVTTKDAVWTIDRRGKPIAVIISVRRYEALVEAAEATGLYPVEPRDKERSDG